MPAESADYRAAVRNALAFAMAARVVKSAEDPAPVDPASAEPSFMDRAVDAAKPVTDAATSAWQTPAVRHALIGGGIGAGLMGLRSLVTPRRRKRLFSDMLTGGLLGGAGGLGVHALRSAFDIKTPERYENPESIAANATASDARQRLGQIGFDPKKTDTLAHNLVTGKMRPEEATAELAKARPDRLEQLASVPGATLDAALSGDFDQAASQADVLGLKNLLPYGRSSASGLGYVGGTFAPVVGANLLARKMLGSHEDRATLGALRGADVQGKLKGTVMPDILSGSVPTWETLFKDRKKVFRGLSPQQKSELARIIKANSTAQPSAGRRLMSKITGGHIPLMASLTPLIAREWFSDNGYRSGRPDLFALANANREYAQHTTPAAQ